MSTIRRAKETDIGRINALLYQVHGIHAASRPDLFKAGAKKYDDDELRALLKDDTKPIWVYLDDAGVLRGYAFCVYETVAESASRHAEKSLYIDDLCVDADCRGQQIGRKICEYVKKAAQDSGCKRVTLNVWALNQTARCFYDAMGFVPLKTMMECEA